MALSAVTKNLVGAVFSEKIGTREIALFSVFRSSHLIGRGLREVGKYATVIGVVRESNVVKNLFEPVLVLQENDTLLVLGDSSNLELLKEREKAT